VRRPAILVPLVLLAAALLARRLLRARAASAPLTAPQPAAPLPSPPSGTRFVSVPWTLVETAAAEPQMAIRYQADEHMQLDRIDAQETPTQVFVTVLMRWSPPTGGWFAYTQEHEAVVELSGPLGARELVHAPVDEPDAPPLYP
jgi:hypothetical protein